MIPAEVDARTEDERRRDRGRPEARCRQPELERHLAETAGCNYDAMVIRWDEPDREPWRA